MSGGAMKKVIAVVLVLFCVSVAYVIERFYSMIAEMLNRMS